MDKQQAQRIIKETFENSFDEAQFVYFIKNLLNSIEEKRFIYRGNFIPDAYEQYINTLERIGKYTDGENDIDILIVKLKKETSIERARTMQRNFISWYLNGSRGDKLKDAALVAFVSPNNDDWRFSLVKMDYRFEEGKNGKMKVKEEFTPSHRWSFLVGKNEKSHTAQSRFIPMLMDDANNPNLAQLEEAFNIEKVTKEFFEKYRDLFLWTKEELDKTASKDERIKTEFNTNDINTVDFAKKLLGQIIFLYFLQKKGWFGVKRDGLWGTGPKNFLRELFEGKHTKYDNFFNDILEPLFYEALRNDRTYDDHYFSMFKCKIPFLNGGLFDPMNNYDWKITDILLPNELFSNSNKTKEGDIGNGILDVFDRYNFTIKEDEPLEKEVAIDPEMLGKAYEKFNAIRPDNYEEYKNALQSGQKGAESQFNKQYGVYYTPREIVHYMCQQSLISYLITELGNRVSKGAIEFLILRGEEYVEHLRTAKQRREDGKNSDRYKEHEYFTELKVYAKEIDECLSNVKVCDPAIGSGAFPVGMMTEIIKARLFFSETKCLGDSYRNKQGDEVRRNTYNYKRDCIQNSLYGVDIDQGAVEIAKLRLWLSLIVDEEDIKNIKPLPNLDYKVMQGNSLVELVNSESSKTEIDLKRVEIVKE
ncbi:MAG: Eco57I restriction-modification methylase domain-containing protein, partial [Caldisericum sp.]|uniref:Eco57I restriction-modification methylase domain-containing protein n=1 Tax=Caldisericum sp. TaxID=2499687 RepID=UPI003D13EB91